MKTVQVVSLAGAAARRAAIASNLAGRGVEFEFFEAVDGARDLAQHGRLFDRDASLKIMGRELSPGELGCALSHALLVQAFLRAGGEFLLVLEDDVELLEAAPASMQALASRHADSEALIVFPSGYDFRPRWRTREPLTEGESLYDNVGDTFGTYGMFISRRVAQRLAEDALPVVVPADFVGRRYGRHRLRVRGVWPPVLRHPHFETDPSASSIGAERRRAELAAGMAGPSAAARWLGKLSMLVRQYL
jgi:glycosyl transferase family 25